MSFAMRPTKANIKRAGAALSLSLAALERCRELLINADAEADDLAEYDAATEAVRLNLEEWRTLSGGDAEGGSERSRRDVEAYEAGKGRG